MARASRKTHSATRSTASPALDAAFFGAFCFFLLMFRVARVGCSALRKSHYEHSETPQGTTLVPHAVDHHPTRHVVVFGHASLPLLLSEPVPPSVGTGNAADMCQLLVQEAAASGW